MKLFPIIPLPEAQLSELLSIAQAEERCEDFALADDVSWLAESNGEDEAPSWTLLKNLLSYGSLRGFVFSYQLNRWGELPAAWWFSAGNCNPDVLAADNSLSPQICGAAFASGPLAVRMSDLDTLLAGLASDPSEDSGTASGSGAGSPRYALAVIPQATDWLCEQFKKKETAQVLRPEWKERALQQFPGLSGKAFNKVWDAAVFVHPERKRSGPRRSADSV